MGGLRKGEKRVGTRVILYEINMRQSLIETQRLISRYSTRSRPNVIIRIRVTIRDGIANSIADVTRSMAASNVKMSARLVRAARNVRSGDKRTPVA